MTERKLVSADSHVNEPPDFRQQRMPEPDQGSSQRRR